MKLTPKIKGWMIGIGVALVFAVTLLCLYLLDYTVEWNVPDDQNLILEYGHPYKKEPVTAEAKGHIFHRKGKKLTVKETGKADVTKLGRYELTYKTIFRGKTYSLKRVVEVVDTTAPELTLAGDTTMQLEAGLPYLEPGFSATDLYDGDTTKNVTVEGTPEIVLPGDYTLIYRVKDSSGNETHMERTLHVVDSTPPALQLRGNDTMYLRLGSSFSEPGYSAWDACEGDCTAGVSISGSVDTNTPGTYTLTYSVNDQSGNNNSCVRTVHVYAPQQNQSVNPGDKVIYLTFDDGPGPYTERLLDILDRYGVKATFFVTNAQPNYRYVIAQEAARGHTVAPHTYSHDYSYVYQNTESYFADLQAMNDIIIEQTGQVPWLLRFPGGSSNTVSANYCHGIMSQLAMEVEMRGYQYCDWNVSSGDAGGTTSSSQVVTNVISGVQSKNVSIVLQHDIKGFSVDAVEQIIQWGLANGYTFLPMTYTTPMTHHGINN